MGHRQCRLPLAVDASRMCSTQLQACLAPRAHADPLAVLSSWPIKAGAGSHPSLSPNLRCHASNHVAATSAASVANAVWQPNGTTYYDKKVHTDDENNTS